MAKKKMQETQEGNNLDNTQHADINETFSSFDDFWAAMKARANLSNKLKPAVKIYFEKQGLKPEQYLEGIKRFGIKAD